MVEQGTENPCVGGPIPSPGTIFMLKKGMTMVKLTRTDLDGLRNFERAHLKKMGIEVEKCVEVEDDHMRSHRLIAARNARVRKLLASVENDRRVSRAEQRQVMGKIKSVGDRTLFRHGRLDLAMKYAMHMKVVAAKKAAKE